MPVNLCHLSPWRLEIRQELGRRPPTQRTAPSLGYPTPKNMNTKWYSKVVIDFIVINEIIHHQQSVDSTWSTEQLLWYTSDPCRPLCDSTTPLALTAHSSIWTRASASYRCFPALVVTLSLLCCGTFLRAGRLWLSSPSKLSSGQALAFSLRRPLLPSSSVSTVALQIPWGSFHTEPFKWA